MSQQKQEWGSRLGVILAVAGSAVGLGNFLRFPGNVAANGGGAFMIPYFCALLFLGIPIGWAEWTMARYGGRKGFHSAPGVLGVVGRGRFARYFGVIGVLIPLGVYFYYVLIEGWCLGYCWEYLTGGIGIDPTKPIDDQVTQSTAHFTGFTGNDANGALFTVEGLHGSSLLFWLITFLVNFYFLYRGLSKGIEAFCKWAMPAMAVAALIVLVRVLTLSPDAAHPDQTVSNGLGYMWNPDFGALKNPQTWLNAAGQIFFSLSVGFGVIINYASYLKKKDDVALSGLTASATNELFEVGFGGLITIPAAFVFLGVTMASLPGGTFGLGFQTLPVVFANMPLGNIVGAVWFFMLFLAAITSSLSMLQPALAFLEESLGISRKAGTALLLLIGTAGNLFVLWYSKDGTVRSTLDDWIGTLLIFVLATVQIICFGWVMGVERGWKELHHGAQIKLPAFWKFIIKFVTPAYLLFVFFMFCRDNLKNWWNAAMENAGAKLALEFAAVVAVSLIIATAIGEKRWRAAGLDVDGMKPPDDELPPTAGAKGGA